eukprot:scaffold21588_cov87-Skeletonema_dohrnii-CCMP3373.AAC.1
MAKLISLSLSLADLDFVLCGILVERYRQNRSWERSEDRLEMYLVTKDIDLAACCFDTLLYLSRV